MAFLSILIGYPLWAQVLINEVCTRNSFVLNDFDEKTPDWIELYNHGNEIVNLSGWSVSDNLNQPNKWIFPEITLEPDSFLIVMASGNNRKAIVDHWETIIHAEESWKYFTPFYTPDTNWKSFGFDDSEWMEGPGGFGRGDDDDNTVLPDTVRTVYLRKHFTINDTSKITSVLLHVDYDDAFIAYLNGVEIVRSNIGWPGLLQEWNNHARDVHTAVMFLGLPPEEFQLDMNQFKSLILPGENVLAIQAFNAWGNHGNFSIIPFLTVGINDGSFSYQELPEWFIDKPVYLHTNFSLAGQGESLVLSNPDNEIIDLVEIPYLKSDHSFGRKPDGNLDFNYFRHPTPKLSNNGSLGYNGYSKEPAYSVPSGFYNGGVEVNFLNQLAGDTIRYTLDGSWVSDTSDIFSGSILIDTTTVVRAQVYSSGLLPGKVSTNTYLIDFSSELPVISLSLNPHDLWDWEDGIYVLGPNASTIYPYKGANFWQDWEKPTHVEYFDENQVLGFELDADIVIHGGFSRANDMKSLRIIASGKYDESEINYPLFKDKDIYSYKRLVLRNSGQDYNITHFRDAVMHKIVQKDTRIEIQDYEPAVVFLNGVYWGIHNLREKIDRYYVNSNFGVPEDSTEIIRENHKIIEGDFYHYVQMIHYVKNVPVVDSVAYENISKQVDLNNYTDYFIAEMYYVNSDGWPNHNTKYWRAKNDTARWHYILTDTDFALGLYSQVYKNELYRVLHSSILWADNHWILRRLMENADYRQYFINRSADMFNTMLLSANVVNKINELKQRIEPEMDRHMMRWGSSYAAWEANVDIMSDFGENRLSYIWQHYIDEFDLTKTVNIGFDIDSVHHGNIKVNTIFPDSLPWQGVYFDGNPIEVSAIADSGYVFSHWASNLVLTNADTLKQKLEINVDTNVLFKAYFVIDTFEPDAPQIVFNEINYRSLDTLDAGDWAELWNVDSISWDLTNWVFKDSDDDHAFVLPAGTVLDPGDYLVLFRDSVMFKNVFPDIESVYGPFEFGLNNGGDDLRLFDAEGNTLVMMTYSNDEPWPTDADGTGKTIELLDPFEDMSDGSNWFSGCIGGSPGGPFIPCDTIGVKDIPSNPENVLIHPNPFSQKTTIEFINTHSDFVDIKLFNVHGILVRDQRLLNLTYGDVEIILKRENLDPGIYFLNLHLKERIYSSKLLVR
ncbi:MAG: CotH kinase family protein [Bacteroidales bacterium]